MTLYFDNVFNEKLVEAIRILYSFESAPDVKIIRGDWSMIDEGKENVVIFLMDFASRGVSLKSRKLYEDGYRVFAFKKKNKSGFTFFSMAFTVLASWKKILEKIEQENQPFIYTLHNNNQRLYSISNI